jgi:hypothetical protein
MANMNPTTKPAAGDPTRIDAIMNEEFPRGAHLPLDRLADEIWRSEQSGDDYVTVKIPSFHEISVRMADAKAYHAREMASARAARAAGVRWGGR